MNWLKKILVEKWIGRLIAIGLAAAGGFLVANGVEQSVVESWVTATQNLLTDALPILIAIILDQIQHRVALHTPPPVK